MIVYSKQDFENKIRLLLEKAGFSVHEVQATQQTVDPSNMASTKLNVEVRFKGFVGDMPRELECPKCGSSKIWKDGLKSQGKKSIERFLCGSCGFRFSRTKKEA